MENSAYNELKLLVDHCERLIDSQGEFFTEGNKVAMYDLINHSKSVLEGTYQVPFIRNREFYKPRQDEDILFATERHTKTPSYYMVKYGLKPAYEWFKRQHIMDESKQTLLEKKAIVLQKAEGLLKENLQKAVEGLGNDIGSFDQYKINELTKRIKGVEGTSGEALGKAIVKVYDAIRRVNHSRRLLSDIDGESNLYFSKKEFELFKDSVLNDKVLKTEYNKVKLIADQNSPEDIERLNLFMQEEIDYEEVNKHFYVWSRTDKIINFKSPKGAAFARLKFVLPSCENEEEGLGHVWIDDVKIYPASGADWDIKNSTFEKGLDRPSYWKTSGEKGQPILKWEDKKPYCGHEKRSIYIENPTPEDEGGWEHTEDISITEDIYNTITFFAKIDGKFKKGLKIVIEFKDIEHNIIEDYSYYFNRKSCFATANYLLTIQADAIVYGFTKDITYAYKVKRQLQFILNDFCQGIENWLVVGARPDGSDAYGSVQGGRIMCSIMSAYTLVKDAGVFSREEMDIIVARLEYFVRYLLDLRDRTELSEFDSQADAGNWQTDMAAGTGMLMMAIPNFPHARQWLENANMILRSQLKFKVNEDGSWPESIRYHFAAFRRFLIYGKALLNCTGENWYDNGPFVKMFRYAVFMQTPPYAFQENRAATITFGDHILDGGRGFYLAGIYYKDVLKYNEEVASYMLETWQKSGSKTGEYRGESVAIENLFAAGNGNIPNPKYPLNLQSCDGFKQSGIYTFRKDFGKPTESLFAIMASPKLVSHGHYDEGSFMIFKDTTPIVVELGIEGYFDSSKDWYISSSSHNVVQFSRKDGKAEPQPYTIHLLISDYSAQRGWVDTPRTCEVLSFDHSNEVDSIEIKILNPEGEGYHLRHVSFYRKSGLYVIADKIIDFKREVRFSLNVASIESTICNNRVLSKGMFGIDLEVVFLGRTPEISIEKGRTAPMFPLVDGKNVVDVIRAKSTGEEGFLTVLYPKRRGESELRIEKNKDKYIITAKEEVVEIN